MTDIHAIISKATSDLIDLTGYEKAVDIQSVLYMNLSGYTLAEECTEVAEAGDKLAEAVEKTLAMEGPVICEIFVSTDQNFEPKSSAKRLPDGTLVSPPLEDLAPFLPDEEMDENMIIPRIKG